MLHQVASFRTRHFAANFILAGALGWLFLMPAAVAQSVSLNWNPSTDPSVAGYKIYYGPASRTYTNSIALGNVTNATISGLVAGATYYFGATTYDAAGDESDFSNEASYAIPAPVVPPPVIDPPVTNSPDTNAPVIPPVIDPPATNPPVATNAPAVNPPVTNAPPVVVNTPPTLNPIASVTINQNALAKAISLTGISSGAASEKQVLKVKVTSSNPALIANPTLAYASPRSTGTLTFSPAANASGTATLTVTVNDGGKSNNLISQSFTVTVLAPVKVNKPGRPLFSKQLTDSAVVKGKTISMNVAATGNAPLRYQWKFNGTPITGAISATLTLKSVSASQAGNYSVTVSNPLGSANSVAAQLSVFATPAATLTATARAANGNFSFQVTGVPGYKYVIQTSADLVNWSSVQTNTAPFTFEDQAAGGFEKRFFRSYYDASL